jgi:hypothetical protein
VHLCDLVTQNISSHTWDPVVCVFVATTVAVECANLSSHIG